MANEITLGRFIDTGSLLHRTDPRVKVILSLVYLIAVFMVKTPLGLGLIALTIIAQIIMAKTSFKILKSTLSPIIPLAIFIFILNIFTTKSGSVWCQWKFIKVTDEGVYKAGLTIARLILIIVSTSVLLTLTTTPLKIADALEKLLGPLKKIKFPVHELAMMMSIALRFVPTLIDETDKITKAQVSRGADYDTGSFFNKIKGFVAILVPLFVSSFKRADELAVAMDSRCYRGGEGRTKLNPLKMTSRDIEIAVIFIVMAIATVIVDRYFNIFL